MVLVLNTQTEYETQAIDLDPKYVKAWAKKGDIEFFMKEYHRAMESYKKGLVRTFRPTELHRQAAQGTPKLTHPPQLQKLNKPTQEIEPNNQLCTQGLQKTVQRIREASSQEVDMERAAHGMADPEVQAILSVRFGSSFGGGGRLRVLGDGGGGWRVAHICVHCTHTRTPSL